MRIFVFGIVVLYIFGFLRGYQAFLRGDTVTHVHIQSILAQCKQNNQGRAYFVCLRQAFSKVVYPKNLPIVIKRVEDIMSQDERGNRIAADACHEVAHIIGEIAGSRAHDVSGLVSSCGNRCGYGCAHGVVVGKLRHQPNLGDLITGVCNFSDTSSVSNAVAIPCFHGIGHAIAEYKSYDVGAALDVCSVFDREEAKRGCFAGVFMETFLPPSQYHNGIAVPKDIVSYCDGLGVGVADMCIGQIVSAQYQRTKNGTQAFAVCASLPAPRDDVCAKGVGAQVYFVEHGDPAQIVKACKAHGKFYKPCVNGAIDSSLAIQMDKDVALTICHHVASPDFRWCQETILAHYGFMNSAFQ